jgi:hypothetical protein
MMKGWMLSTISVLYKLILYRPEHNPMKPQPEPKLAQAIMQLLSWKIGRPEMCKPGPSHSFQAGPGLAHHYSHREFACRQI